MPSCVVKNCKNNSKSHKKSHGITFHLFPKENEWRKDWIQIIRECRSQMDWNPTKSSVVCSEHFQTSDLYTTKGGLVRVVSFAIPKKFLWGTQSGEQQNEQPAVSERSFEESLEKPALSNEERLLPIEFKWHTPVSELSVEGDKISKTINRTDFTLSTDEPSHIVERDKDEDKVEADFAQPFSILNTPKIMWLKKIILKKDLHISRQKQKIKILNQKIRRLKNRNLSLRNIVKTLKNKNVQ